MDQFEWKLGWEIKFLLYIKIFTIIFFSLIACPFIVPVGVTWMDF